MNKRTPDQPDPATDDVGSATSSATVQTSGATVQTSGATVQTSGATVQTSGAIAQTEVASYEAARDELASVVSRLESGGLSLDESLTLWERGEHLAAVCSRFLDGARERVEKALAAAEQD